MRETLAAAAGEQEEGFDAMMGVLREEPEAKVRKAVETFDALHRSFGDSRKSAAALEGRLKAILRAQRQLSRPVHVGIRSRLLIVGLNSLPE